MPNKQPMPGDLYYTSAALLPTHPGFDPFKFSPFEWRRECWKRIPSECPECGQQFIRPRRTKGTSLKNESYFCSSACWKRWRYRLDWHYLPKTYRNLTWPGKIDREPPPELAWVKAVWNKERDAQYKNHKIDMCGAPCNSYPTNSFPLRKDKRGEGCTYYAGDRTEHPGYGWCSLHGGKSPTYTKRIQRQIAQREMLEVQIMALGEPITDIDPEEAIMQELYRTVGHVAFLERLIQETPKEDLLQYQKGVAVNGPWLALYESERDRLVKVANTAAGMGIAERRIKIVEQQGRMLAGIMQQFLLDSRMNWSPKQLVDAKAVLRELFATAELPVGATSTPSGAMVLDAEVIEED